MCNRPARRFGDISQPILPIETINFINNAVDIVRQIRPRPFDTAIMRERLFYTLHARQHWRNGHSPCSNCSHHAALGISRQVAHFAPTMRQKPQRSGCGNASILLPKRSRSCVARIGKYLAALRLLFDIESGEIGLRHINFTANFEHRRNVALKLLWNAADHPDIGSHLLTN